MLMRNVFLYLSRRPLLKGVLTTFPGAKQVTARFIAGENIDDVPLQTAGQWTAIRHQQGRDSG